MTVQAVITQRKSLDRNVIGKNEPLLGEIQSPAPSVGARLSLRDDARTIMAMQRGCCLCADACNSEKMAEPMQVFNVDKESSGSKQKFCPHSIFSMSAGVGRGSEM